MLRRIEGLANTPTARWSAPELAAFPHVTNGLPDPPPDRVSRWARIFADELAEVHRLVAGPRQLSDVELHQTLYLAGRLLSTVTDRRIEEVDQFEISQE